MASKIGENQSPVRGASSGASPWYAVPESPEKRPRDEGVPSVHASDSDVGHVTVIRGNGNSTDATCLLDEVKSLEHLVQSSGKDTGARNTEPSIIEDDASSLQELHSRIDEIESLISSLRNQFSSAKSIECQTCGVLRAEIAELKKTSFPVFPPSSDNAGSAVQLASARLRSITASLNNALHRKK